jgi:transcriptional regulator with XRE-family HTH domain
MDARARVARNVRRLRVAAGLSQEAFAVDTGLDRTYISRIERNLENPTVMALEKIAKALGADIVDLVAGGAHVRGTLPTLRPGRKRGNKRR